MRNRASGFFGLLTVTMPTSGTSVSDIQVVELGLSKEMAYSNSNVICFGHAIFEVV